MQHGKSSAIAKNHFALRYNILDEENGDQTTTIGRFEIMAFEPLYIKDKMITRDDGFVPLKHMDELRIYSEKCSTPIIFKFLASNDVSTI